MVALNTGVFIAVGYREYTYSVFAANSIGEGPLVNGTFLTREDSEYIHCMLLFE